MGLQQQGLRNGSRYHQVISFKKVDSKGRPRSSEAFLFFVCNGCWRGDFELIAVFRRFLREKCGKKAFSHVKFCTNEVKFGGIGECLLFLSSFSSSKACNLWIFFVLLRGKCGNMQKCYVQRMNFT